MREHLVAEHQQVPGDSRRRVYKKRQQVDFRIPKVVALICLPCETLCRHSRALRTRRGLHDMKKVEPVRLLNLEGRALRAVFSEVLHSDIASAPKIAQVLLLPSEQLLNPLGRHAIHCPLSTATEFFGRSSL